MNCPVCGKEMAPGELRTENSVGLYFIPRDGFYESVLCTKRGIEKCGGVVLDGLYPLRPNETRLDAFLCRDCRRAVVAY